MTTRRPGAVVAVAGILLACVPYAMAQPQNARALERHREASVLIQKGQAKEAVTKLQAALEADPNHVDSIIDLAWIRATATPDDVRDPKQALAMGERMLATIIQNYNNRFQEGSQRIRSPWAGLPQSPGFYKVHVFSVMAAAYAATGRFRAPGAPVAVSGDVEAMGRLAGFNSTSPNAVGFGELAAEQAAREARIRPTTQTRRMLTRTREYLALYRKETPLRGVPKP